MRNIEVESCGGGPRLLLLLLLAPNPARNRPRAWPPTSGPPAAPASTAEALSRGRLSIVGVPSKSVRRTAACDIGAVCWSAGVACDPPRSRHCLSDMLSSLAAATHAPLPPPSSASTGSTHIAGSLPACSSCTVPSAAAPPPPQLAAAAAAGSSSSIARCATPSRISNVSSAATRKASDGYGSLLPSVGEEPPATIERWTSKYSRFSSANQPCFRS
jgi:hypothetical protein